ISLRVYFFFSSRRRHTRFSRDWSSDVCSSDLEGITTRRKADKPGPRCAMHHREKLSACRDTAWERHLWETYGITLEQYWTIYKVLGGRCYLCRRANDKRRKLVVDHDHVSLLVRVLVCRPCNRNVLGHSRDDPEFFRRGIEYLANPPAVAAIGKVYTPK